MEAAELADFGRRGLLRGGDFIRSERSHHWTPWEPWLLEQDAKAPSAAKKPGPSGRKAAAKKAPAKKAARKAPPKKSSPEAG